MRLDLTIVVLIIVLAVYALTPAHAAPLTLVCTGSIWYEGTKQNAIDRQTAVLDIEGQTFKPPLYPELPITKVSDTMINFALNNETREMRGSIDRVSGALTFQVATSEEHRKLETTGSFRPLAMINARCTPAQKMF